MLKVVGSIMVVSASFFLGMSAKKSLVDKIKCLDAFTYLIDFISAEISFNLTSIPEIFKKAHSVYLQNFIDEVNKGFIQNKKSFAFIWITALKNQKEKYGLGSFEYDALFALANILGRYSDEEQVKALRQAKEKISIINDLLKKDLKSKGQIYNVCAVAFGILIVLCFV